VTLRSEKMHKDLHAAALQVLAAGQEARPPARRTP